jgi:hypothetical protein
VLDRHALQCRSIVELDRSVLPGRDFENLVRGADTRGEIDGTRAAAVNSMRYPLASTGESPRSSRPTKLEVVRRRAEGVVSCPTPVLRCALNNARASETFLSSRPIASPGRRDRCHRS